MVFFQAMTQLFHQQAGVGIAGDDSSLRNSTLWTADGGKVARCSSLKCYPHPFKKKKRLMKKIVINKN